jgi:hypothetical protein
VTISTPQPLDRPDWYNAASYATSISHEQLVSVTGITNFGYFYVGDAPAFGFVAQIAGGAWQLHIDCNNGPTSLVTGIEGDLYTGDTDCTVHDNLPTASAWVSIEVIGGTFLDPLTTDLWWWASQTAQAGSTLNLDRGLAINVTGGNCPHGEVTNFYSSLLLPGIHQYCFDANANLMGIANLSGKDGTSLAGRMVRIFNPAVDVGYDGQVVVSNIQPVWQIVNSGGADVTVNATLTRGF